MDARKLPSRREDAVAAARFATKGRRACLQFQKLAQTNRCCCISFCRDHYLSQFRPNLRESDRFEDAQLETANLLGLMFATERVAAKRDIKQRVYSQNISRERPRLRGSSRP